MGLKDHNLIFILDQAQPGHVALDHTLEGVEYL